MSPGPNGITTNNATVPINTSIGADLKTGRSASSGIRSSFWKNLTPSAISCAQPQRPPVPLKELADVEQDLGGDGNGAAEIAEDVGEAWDDEGHEEHHRARAHRREEGRVDEGGRERLPQRLRLLQIFGEAL